MTTKYLIQAIKIKSPVVYVLIDATQNVAFVSQRQNATLFESQVLARGWITKAKAMNRFYQYSIITL
jgi:hypothetical protein